MESTRNRRRSLLLLVALGLGLVPSAIVGLTRPTSVLASGPSRVTEFSEASGSEPLLADSSASGTDGNVWFTNYSSNEIGKITPAGVITRYSVAGGSNPSGITLGPDGNMWFAELSADAIGKITPSGSVTTYNVPTASAYPYGIVAGPDGDLWFTEYVSNKIGKVTTSGTFTEYSIGATTNPVGITAGPDGNLWFTQETGSKVGKITTSGTITQYSASASSTPFYITSGPDGNLWFTEEDGNNIAKITTSGTITEYAIPTGSSSPHGITTGADGNLWFTESAAGKLGSITTSGTITEHDVIPTANSHPEGIVTGPDHNLWFMESSANNIGRYALSPVGGAPTDIELRGGGANFCLVCTIDNVARGIASSHPVDTENGNFYHDFVDFNIPGRSYPLAITRTYNSDAASVDGPFGYGWNYNYGSSLAVTGTSPNEVATITQENGSQVTFDEPASGSTWTPAASRYDATLTYNSGSSTWTFVRKAKDTYTFNSSGQLTQEEDLNGYTTSLSYTSGDLTTVTDPAGRTLTLNWTGSHVTSITDANVTPNRTVSYSYDGSGNLQDVTDVNSGDTNFAYDGSHRMTTMKDPVCEAAVSPSCPGVQNHYDGNGRVDWQKDQLNRETTFSYSGDPSTETGSTTTITDPASNVSVDAYEYGVRVQHTSGYGTAAAAATSFMYDPDTLALTETMDANGNVTTYTVDSSGNILTKTDPLGRVTTNTYNGFNEVLTTEDGNGVTTTNTYDGDGNLTSTKRPLVGSSPLVYQETDYAHTNGTYPGDVTSITDPDGKVTDLHYDSNGYADEIKDPAGNVTATVRNDDGWTTATYTGKAGCTWGSAAPTGCSSTYETQYSYVVPGSSPAVTNEFGEVGTVTDPLSHTTKSTYDADGNTVSTTDGNGNTTDYTYDFANELTTTTRPDSTTEVTDYNSDGTVADRKDGKGNAIVTYGYDSLGRVTSTEDANSHTTYYTLDGDGNILTKKDPVSGATCTGTLVGCTTYTYDADNEIKTVSYSDSSSENVTSTTYDSDGQRTAMTDGTGSSSWTFDSLHRLTAYTKGDGATVTYGYGSDLKNQAATIAYPNSVGTVTQTWNDDGTLASVENWNSKTVAFGYDANDNLHTITDPSTTNVTDTFGFNAADQMTSVSDSNGSTLFSATYTRDSNGQLASDSSQASNQADDKYNSLNQLCYAGSSTSNACSSPPGSSYPYAFDSADNLTTNNGTTQQYNAADELCWTVSGSSANACGSVPSGATTYGYNNKGDETSAVPSSGSATCFGYDQTNLLTSIKTGTGSSCTSPTTVGTYGYDGDGLRESKTVSGTTTQFTWDGAGSQILQQDDGTTKTSFIFGPGGLPVEQIAGSTTTYLHHDQIGSTRLITDSAGATGTATTQTWDPYGNSVSTSGSLTSPFGFTGVYTDAESGLLAATHRYYDPTTATWLSVDPLVSRTMQPYQYVAGNPLNLTDRAGLNSTAQDQNPFEVIGGDIEDISGLFGGPLVNLVPEELPNGIDNGGLEGILDPGGCNITDIGNIGGLNIGALHSDGNGGAATEPGIGTGGETGAPWDVKPTDTPGDGIIFQPGGAEGNDGAIRIMNPGVDDRYPDGYIRIYNDSGQPLDENGNPGSKPDTHHVLPTEELQVP